MIYTVRAKPVEEKGLELLTLLTDGTIASQKPDGKEIIASMERARITTLKSGEAMPESLEGHLVEWSEACFCPTPLEHERSTILDRFFSEIQIFEVDDHVDFNGAGFMEYLRARWG